MKNTEKEVALARYTSGNAHAFRTEIEADTPFEMMSALANAISYYAEMVRGESNAKVKGYTTGRTE